MVVIFAFFAPGFVLGAQVEKEADNMELTSTAFRNNGFIPKTYTCDGEDISPSLVIKGIPPDAKSLALIVDDPDAPAGTWVHWVVFNIPITLEIKENSVPGIQGVNDSRQLGYGGPCPPSGVHRYFFKIYALDTLLNLKEGITKGALEKAMQPHILDKAELVGLYKRG